MFMKNKKKNKPIEVTYIGSLNSVSFTVPKLCDFEDYSEDIKNKIINEIEFCENGFIIYSKKKNRYIFSPSLEEKKSYYVTITIYCDTKKIYLSPVTCNRDGILHLSAEEFYEVDNYSYPIDIDFNNPLHKKLLTYSIKKEGLEENIDTLNWNVLESFDYVKKKKSTEIKIYEISDFYLDKNFSAFFTYENTIEKTIDLSIMFDEAKDKYLKNNLEIDTYLDYLMYLRFNNDNSYNRYYTKSLLRKTLNREFLDLTAFGLDSARAADYVIKRYTKKIKDKYILNKGELEIK